MKPSELTATLQRKGLGPLYLVLGEESYLRDQAIDAIRARATSTEQGEASEASVEESLRQNEAFSCDVLYGDETDAQEVLACAQEVPFFSSHRLIVLKWAEKLSARDGEALTPYFLAPCDSTTLVVSASKLDGRLKWVQALKRQAIVVDCVPLYENQRLGWVRNEASRLGIQLDPGAALHLKDLADDGLYGVRCELDKLALYVPPGRKVAPEDVVAVQGTEPGASVFDLAGAIANGNYAEALRILEKNLEAGEAPLRILGALVWQYRRLWKAKDGLTQGLNQAKIARPLGIPPFKQQEFFSLVHRFSGSHFSKALTLFIKADSSLKGGAAGSPHRVLHSLIFSLCQSVRM